MVPVRADMAVAWLLMILPRPVICLWARPTDRTYLGAFWVIVQIMSWISTLIPGIKSQR